MALVLERGLGLDGLQPLAAGIDTESDPQPKTPDSPPVINTYDPSVEQWRNAVWEGMPDALKNRPDAPVLLDKALHTIRGESGGDPTAVGDGGLAQGLFQSHYIPAGADSGTQIADAWRLVQGDLANGGTGFGDWGEGRTYNGGPFGAFGRTPYGAGDPLAQHLSTGQTSNFAPGPALPYPGMPGIPDFTQPQDNLDIGNIGSGALPPTGLPDTGGPQDNTGFGGYGPNLLNQLPGRQGYTQESTGQPYTAGSTPDTSDNPLLAGATLFRLPFAGLQAQEESPVLNPYIPGVTPTLERAKGVVGDIGSQAGAQLVAPYQGITRPLAARVGINLPSLGGVPDVAGSVASGLVPTRGGDIATTLAPLVGEARPALAAARGGLEEAALRGIPEELGAAAPDAAADVESRLAARGRVTPAGGAPDELPPELGATPQSELGPTAQGVQSHFTPGEEPGGQATKFTTSKGSEYTVNGDGTTTRNKSFHPEHGPADVGLQPTSEATIYVTPEDANRLSLIQAQGGSPMKLARMPDGRWALQYTGGPDVGKFISGTAVDAAQAPVAGLYPVEMWDGGKTVHFGNEITSVQIPPGGPQGPDFSEIPSATSPFDKLMNAVSSASQQPEANAASYAEQRAQRTAIWYQVRDQALADGASQAEATAKAAPYLRQSGEMARADFEPLHQAFTPEDLDTLRSEPGYALDDGRLRGPYDVHNTQDALEKVLNGDFGHLAEHELDLLRTVYGPQLADSIAARTAELGGPRGLASSLHYVATRGLANLLSLIDSFTTTATFGHLTPLRYGFGQLFSPLPEERAAAREAWGNMYRVLRNPENADAIREGLRADPLIAGEGTLSPEDEALAERAGQRGIQFQDFQPHPQTDDTMVNTILKKLGLSGNRFSQATRTYLDTIQQRSYADGARALLMSEDATGKTLDPKEYRGLYDSYAHIVGKAGSEGEFGTRLPTAGNPAFSLQGLVSRYKRIFDPLVQPGVLSVTGPGAKAAAVRGWIGTALAGSSVAAIAQATGLGSVSTDGKIHFGSHTLDPFSGSSSAIRSLYNLEQAAMGAKDIPDAASRILQSVQQTARGQVSPGWDFLLSLIGKKDWAGRPEDLQTAVENLLKDSTPLGPHSIYDMLRAGDLHGIPGLAQTLGAGSSALLGGTVDTNQLQAARDAALTPDLIQQARAAGEKQVGTDYASSGPILQKLINDQQAVKDQQIPSAYKAAKARTTAPIKAEVAQQEDLFNRGMNTQKLRDTYHDATEKNIQNAIDMEDQFASNFASIPQSTQQQLLQKYYDLSKSPDALVPKGQNLPDEGQLDYDKLASMRADFLKSLPANQQQFIQESLQASENNKTKTQQAYDKYIADKKAAGYFDIPRNDPDYSKKVQALDKANPTLDAETWRYGATNGQGGGSLQTVQAVDQALKMNVPNVPVHIGSLPRDLSTPGGRALWQADGAKVAALEDGSLYTARYGDTVAEDKFQKPYSQLTTAQQSTVLSSIRNSVLASDPSLDALWVYFGGSPDGTAKHYVLKSQASLPYLQQLIKQYGPGAPRPDWTYGVSTR